MPQEILAPFERNYAFPIETYRQVQSTANRDAIPNGIRWEGMQCYVVATGLTYYLKNGITNANWTELGGSGLGEGEIDVIDNLVSTSTTAALSANQGRVLNEGLANKLSLSGGTLTGMLTAPEFTRNSDLRLKKNISTYQPKHIELNWMQYEYKNGSPNNFDLGVIAQALEVTHPEFVVTCPDSGMKAVRYSQLIIAKLAELEHKINLLYADSR